jgi:hypothetical protein
MPSFEMVFDSILWQLQRSPLDEAALIPGSNPPVRVLETNAWRAAGIPPLRIGFKETPEGMEVIQLAALAERKR